MHSEQAFPETYRFSYEEAFSRNLGWLTLAEQARLRNTRIGVAGLGGNGGYYVTALARLGVGRLSIADFDSFELANFNRQAGGTLSSLGRKKIDVMSAMVRDINPEIGIRQFPDGVNSSNVLAFLDGVDVYLDAIDLFQLDARELVFAACARSGTPAVSSIPLGMGAAYMSFVPGRMTFEDYFGLSGHDDTEKVIRLLLGFAPSRMHMGYLVDPGSVRLAEGRSPSTAMGCLLCAGAAVTEVLKIVLGRGTVLSAPHSMHFDSFRNKFTHTWRPGGHRNPLQRLALRKALGAMQR